MYISLTLVMIFFYDALPIVQRVYTAKAQINYQFCPLYFSVDFNTSTMDYRSATWYTINDTYDGHVIQCIGRSPYILRNGHFLDNCFPDYLPTLCNGIEL